MIDEDLILENEIATRVIGIAIDVHRQLGPGLLENAYKQVLAFKLQKAGIFVEVEKKMPLEIDEINLDVGYIIDILVERKLVLELKSVDILNDVHFAQTLNYVKIGKYKLGLLINFNVSQLKYGIQRVANTKPRI
ncbi:GxxExxY protein [Algoriphagus winogradskyi]|uniref:GxxExxY protein n=1 Tax=Algoriphagus winogradskyi TaxID=237017 RepID=A0ABY1N7T0_9BACT|nr:GxxExxY protein [Algoriphagus winogradskyi]SMP02752.1 GxxExxY protein [Algoriphagus winogradskyi]